MKNKIIAICVLVCLLAVSSLGLVACGGGRLSIKIDSSKEATIKVGEEYTLAYTATGNDSVTVEVTEGAGFGAYDEATKKFTASAVGVAKLTVTAVNGDDKATDVVTINITANDKTSLAAAITAAEALKSSDYTSFTALSNALKAAKAINTAADATGAQISGAIAALNTATTALVARLIVKAEITAAGIAYAGKDYAANGYGNYAEVKTAIEAINADATIKLISVYNAKVTAEFNKLAEFEDKLVIAGITAGHTNQAPKASYALTATGTTEAISWYVNGEKKGEGASYTLNSLNRDIIYTIEARAKEGDKFVRGITEVAFWNKLTYTANHSTTSVDNVSGTVTSNDNAGWNPYNKVLGDFWLEGDISIQFDLTITKKDTMDPNTVAVLLMSDPGRGHAHQGEFAIKYRDEKLKLWANAVESAEAMPVSVLDSGVKNTFLIERIDGFMHFSIINKETGEKLYTIKTEGDKNWKEKVTVNFNFEDSVGSVEDIRITADKITNMSDMAEQLRAAKSLIESDYSAGWTEFKTAYDAAYSAYSENKNINQVELTALAKELKDAIAALTPNTFAKAVVTDEKITFATIDFLATDYTNYADIKTAVTELNKATIASQYTAQIYTELAKLTSEIVQTVTGVGSYGFATFKEARTVEISVSGAEGATHKLFVDGVEKTLTNNKITLSFTEAANQKIAVTTTLSGKNITRFYDLKIIKNDFILNDWKNEVRVDNENCEFEAFAKTEWDNHRKVVSNIWLQGDFKITFDATPTKFDGANVMAIILSPNNDWGNDDRGEMAMLFGDKQLKARPNQTRSGVVNAMGELNKKLTYCVQRTNGEIVFSVLDGATMLGTVTSPEKNYNDDVRMVFNFEHMLGKMGNVNFFATSTR